MTVNTITCDSDQRSRDGQSQTFHHTLKRKYTTSASLMT